MRIAPTTTPAIAPMTPACLPPITAPATPPPMPSSNGMKQPIASIAPPGPRNADPQPEMVACRPTATTLTVAS